MSSNSLSYRFFFFYLLIFVSQAAIGQRPITIKGFVKDKINDYFNVYGKRVRIVKSLAIYDRWGEQVYKAENLLDANKGGREIGWNGSFRGELVMPGVYVFVADIEFEGSSGSEIYKGDFTVIR